MCKGLNFVFKFSLLISEIGFGCINVLFDKFFKVLLKRLVLLKKFIIGFVILKNLVIIWVVYFKSSIFSFFVVNIIGLFLKVIN